MILLVQYNYVYQSAKFDVSKIPVYKLVSSWTTNRDRFFDGVGVLMPFDV